MKVYAIGGIQKCADKFIDCTPFEVLAYFKNAEEIITDTFHGSIFSVITHRRFITLVRKSEGSSYGNEEKLTDLLIRLGLEERCTCDIEQVEKIMQYTINYKDVDQILVQCRKEAFEYLQMELTKS